MYETDPGLLGWLGLMIAAIAAGFLAFLSWLARHGYTCLRFVKALWRSLRGF